MIVLAFAVALALLHDVEEAADLRVGERLHELRFVVPVDVLDQARRVREPDRDDRQRRLRAATCCPPGSARCSRYWWKTSALGRRALRVAAARAVRQDDHRLVERHLRPAASELPSEPNASCVIVLICEKSARSLPVRRLVDLNALSALPRSARCLNVFHFVSVTTCTSSKNMRSMRSFGCIASMNSCAMARASREAPAHAARGVDATSHAVPTFGWFCALPHCVLSTNFVSVSSPDDLHEQVRVLPRGRERAPRARPASRAARSSSRASRRPVTPAHGCEDVAQPLELDDLDDRRQQGLAVVEAGARVDPQDVRLAAPRARVARERERRRSGRRSARVAKRNVVGSSSTGPRRRRHCRSRARDASRRGR